jgi:hypothetical protein
MMAMVARRRDGKRDTQLTALPQLALACFFG